VKCLLFSEERAPPAAFSPTFVVHRPWTAWSGVLRPPRPPTPPFCREWFKVLCRAFPFSPSILSEAVTPLKTLLVGPFFGCRHKNPSSPDPETLSIPRCIPPAPLPREAVRVFPALGDFFFTILRESDIVRGTLCASGNSRRCFTGRALRTFLRGSSDGQPPPGAPYLDFCPCPPAGILWDSPPSFFL